MQWTLWVKTGDCLDLKAPSQHKLSHLGLESLEAHTRSTVNACSCVSKGSHWKVACTRQEVGIGPDQTWKHTKTCGVCSSCQMLSENGHKINIQRSAHISHTHIYILHSRLSNNAHLYHFTMSGHPFFGWKPWFRYSFQAWWWAPCDVQHLVQSPQGRARDHPPSMLRSAMAPMAMTAAWAEITKNWERHTEQEMVQPIHTNVTCWYWNHSTRGNRCNDQTNKWEMMRIWPQSFWLWKVNLSQWLLIMYEYVIFAKNGDPHLGHNPSGTILDKSW